MKTARKVTITISADAYQKARDQAAEADMTVAQWCSWVIEAYDPPVDINPEEYGY